MIPAVGANLRKSTAASCNVGSRSKRRYVPCLPEWRARRAGHRITWWSSEAGPARLGPGAGPTATTLPAGPGAAAIVSTIPVGAGFTAPCLPHLNALLMSQTPVRTRQSPRVPDQAAADACSKPPIASRVMSSVSSSVNASSVVMPNGSCPNSSRFRTNAALTHQPERRNVPLRDSLRPGNQGSLKGVRTPRQTRTAG